jgi:hypothetical protein
MSSHVAVAGGSAVPIAPDGMPWAEIVHLDAVDATGTRCHNAIGWRSLNPADIAVFSHLLP